jgi:hypothetical protein
MTLSRINCETTLFWDMIQKRVVGRVAIDGLSRDMRPRAKAFTTVQGVFGQQAAPAVARRERLGRLE